MVQLGEEDRRLIRQELFLGHLLTLAASSGAVPPHALPSIAGMLQAEGLIPKWLAYTLTQQPALFDRAFQRVFQQVGLLLWRCHSCSWLVNAGALCLAALFHNPCCLLACERVQELEAAAAEPDESESEDPMHWAAQRFWKRRAAPLLASRSLGHMRRWGPTCLQPSGPPHTFLPVFLFTCSRLCTCCSRSGMLSPAADPLPASRYETDFTELRPLGRGGYGVVVSGKLLMKHPRPATSDAAHHHTCAPCHSPTSLFPQPT